MFENIDKEPKWFWYQIGQNKWEPLLGERVKIFVATALIFFLMIGQIIGLFLIGIKTPVFEFLRIFGENTGLNELIWVAYGSVLGIGASLVFASDIDDYKKSVFLRLRTSLIRLLYFDGFFIFINIWLFIFGYIFVYFI